MTTTTDNHNPFSLQLGEERKDIEGVHLVYLDFLPQCDRCGKQLGREHRIATAKEPPLIPGHSSIPNYLCPQCQVSTKYSNKMLLDCIHEFHLKYPTKYLLDRGIRGLSFVNRWRRNEDLT